MAKKQSRRSISLRGATYTAIRIDCAASELSLSDYIEQLIADDRHRRGLPRVARPIDAVIERVVSRAVVPEQRPVIERSEAPAPRSNRTRVLEALQAEPEREFSLAELQEIKGGSPAALSVMLAQFSRAGLVERGSSRGMWRAAKKAAQPLPSESAIKAGPPVAQLKLIERQPTLKTDGGLSKSSGMRSPSKSRAWDDSHLLPAHQVAAKKAAAQQRQVIPEGTKATSRGMVGRPTGERVAPAPKVASGAALERAVKADAVAALHGGRAGMVGF